MDRRHLLRILGVTAATAGLSPGQLVANQNPSITYMASPHGPSTMPST